MATINFRIKGTKNPTNIYIRLRHKNIDCEVSTGIVINKNDWSTAKKKAKSSSSLDYTKINNSLDSLKTHILNAFNEDLSNGQLINRIWLKESINNSFGIANEDSNDYKRFMTDFVKLFIEQSKTRKNRNGTPLSKDTIKHYKSTLNKIINYEIHKNIRLKISDINLSFHRNFIDYLEIEDALNFNTIGGYIDDIKLFCNRADKNGIKTNPEFKLPEFYTPHNETFDIYLTEAEINEIYSQDFSENDRLDNTRDWLIIGLWTGLRISDFLKLDKTNIDKDFFEIRTKKTDYPVIIPIHNQVQQILNKRDGNFPRKISDQKFNEYVKEVCLESGINQIVEGAKKVKIKHKGKYIFRKIRGEYPKNELVSGHTCRRSFATNHYGKVDTMTIMRVTGHKTEHEFLKYIKITPKEYAIKMRDFWKKSNY